MKTILTGNEAAALAVKLVSPEVVAAYPITPQTSIAEKLAEYAARGEMRTRCLKVKSETSALAACIGGALAGARAFTATSSQGLALMHELLHWASGARLPIVIVNVNRSMAAPWSLGVDHNDTLSQRDTGCLQLYCETAQEVLDSVLIAFKLAEATLLPILVCMDGFLLSHYSEPVEVPAAETVARFLGKRRARYRMDPAAPCTFGGGVNATELFRLRRQLQEDMDRASVQFERIAQRFAGLFGRRYRAVETLNGERRELALVANGTLAGTIRAYLKQQGFAKGVGLVKMRLFRPFPAADLRRALAGFRAAAVIDRNLSPGSGGIFAQEIKAALYGGRRTPPLAGIIAGLGGVDITPRHLDALVDRLRSCPAAGPELQWMEV